MVQPSFFGDSESPLLGVFHQSQKPDVRFDSVFVLCYPVAQEYLRVHWVFRQLSNLLAREGYPVFRFDYFGTGDSFGKFQDATLTRWKQDVVTAIVEAKRISHASKVRLVGQRLGATLAAEVCVESSEELGITDLVLWDPVVNGKEYLVLLKALDDAKRNRGPYSRLESERTQNELLGFVFSEFLQGELESCDLRAKLQSPRGKTVGELRSWLFASQKLSEYSMLASCMKKYFREFSYQYTDEDGMWDVLEEVQSALFAGKFLQVFRKTLELEFQRELSA